jgi:predicted permease
MTMLRDLLHDLRHGARGLRRTPGFAALVVLSLGLGLGACAAIFSLVNAVLLRPLPVRDPGGLVSLSQGDTTGPWGEPNRLLDVYSYPLYRRLQSEAVFSGLAAQQGGTTSCAVRAGEHEPPAEAATGRAVSGNFFEVVGVAAQRGRLLAAADDTATAEPVVVLSHGYWQRRFGGDQALVGTRLEINATRYTVVGILAPRFEGTAAGERIDLWVPLHRHAQLVHRDELLTSRMLWWLHLFGRLAPNIDRSAAQASANVTLQRFLAEDRFRVSELPDTDPTVAPTAKDVRIELGPGGRGLSGMRQTFAQPLLVLMAGVGLLLLIVCLNVGHLLLLRAIRRQRELNIRAALGASRGRLVRQLVTEGLLLSVLGGIAGALAMRWLVDGILAVAPGGTELDVAVDGTVWAFGTVCTMIAGVLVGLAPAWQVARRSLQPALRTGAGATDRRAGRLGRVLMVSQVVFAVVLLVGAVLLGATLERLRAVDLGVDRERLLVATVMPRTMGLDQARALLLHEALAQRASALPGVRSASMSALSGYWSLQLPSGATSGTGVQRVTVTPEHFQTVGLRLLQGRAFTRQDHDQSAPVAIVNRALARQLFGEGTAVGRRFRLVAGPPQDMEVVGVVSDARQLFGQLREAPAPAFYRPAAQAHDMLSRLEVRAAGDPALLTADVRRAIGEVAPGLPIGAVRTMTERTEEALRPERLMAMLSRGFGLTALFLVALGLFGVVGQWAAQRTPELGVRMALGATTGEVRWLVLRQSLALVLVGVVLGIPTAAAASRLLAGVLFGVQPLHAPALGVAAAALFLVAVLAAYLPARRASRVDPMTALRSE